MMKLLIITFLSLLFTVEIATAASFRFGGIKMDVATQSTAAGTTTLTASSSQIQEFSGSSAQTVKLPSASTLANGYFYTVTNEGSGTVTVQNNGGATLKALTASTSATYVLTSTGSTAGVWAVVPGAGSSGGGGSSATCITTASGGTFTRVTGSAPTALGQYRSYLRAGSTRTFSETNGTPTTAPNGSDGFNAIMGYSYAAGDSSNNPSQWDVYIGTGKALVQIRGYASTGKSGYANAEAGALSPNSTDPFGFSLQYDSSIGVARLTPPNYNTGTFYFSQNFAGSVLSNGYFDICYQ